MSQIVSPTRGLYRGSEEADRAALTRTWQNPHGLLGWFSVTTHQAIGRRYIVTAFLFLLLGGIEALHDAHPAGEAG